MSKLNRRCGTAALLALAVAACVPTVRAAGPTTAPVALEQQNADLQRRLDDMQRQMDELKQAVRQRPAVAAAPTTAPSTTAVGTGGTSFQSLFLDEKPVELPGDVTAGYKGGFYLKQGDAFSLKAGGVFDVRYGYTDAQNKTSLTTTPLGTNRQGSLSGFNLYNGNLSLEGELFKHGQSEALFKATGNFGTLQVPTGTLGGTFILNELYGGYAFNDAFKIRAGAMITPLTPFLGLTLNGGLTFPTVANELITFLPGFSLGADVTGQLADNSILYDFMVNNGSVGQGVTNSTGVLAGSDNRVGVAGRIQIAGSGKVSDFLDESDTQDHQKFVWNVDGGVAWESQNSSANAFPGSQTTLKIQGLSSSDPAGFRAPYTVNGDLLRYVAGLRAKYHGFSFVSEGQYQQIINETNASPIPGYGHYKVGETGFFVQAGYFILPKHLELAGRFGQLYTNGLAHEMDEYTFGANYYLFGENLKFQLAETYVPRQAALTSNTGLLINTQDWVTQAQVQLKF